LLFGPACTTSLWGQNPPPAQPPPWERDATNRPPAPTRLPPPEASVLTNMVFRPVGAGVFELGKLRFDKKQRTITFPALVNSSGGPIEYFLVTAYGKTHESVLRTEAEPIHLQLAMLLLDAKGDPDVQRRFSQTQGPGSAPPPPQASVSEPGPELLKGDPVQIEVSWTAEGKAVKCPAEQLVFNQATTNTLKSGQWVYNGSLVMEGQFCAQRDGSIVSLITDSLALINNVAPGHENDDIWTINTNRVPPMNAPVEVTIRLK
jgi:hypothetical protein